MAWHQERGACSAGSGTWLEAVTMTSSTYLHVYIDIDASSQWLAKVTITEENLFVATLSMTTMSPARCRPTPAPRECVPPAS